MYGNTDAFNAWADETLYSELYISEGELTKLNDSHGVKVQSKSDEDETA